MRVASIPIAGGGIRVCGPALRAHAPVGQTRPGYGVAIVPDPLPEEPLPEPLPLPLPEEEKDDEPLDLPEDPLLEPLPDPEPDPLPLLPDPLDACVASSRMLDTSLWTHTPSAENVFVPGMWMATVRVGASTCSTVCTRSSAKRSPTR